MLHLTTRAGPKSHFCGDSDALIKRSFGCSYAAVDGDVEREPLGKRALGGRVSAKIILIDTAYGPFPSKKREAAKTY